MRGVSHPPAGVSFNTPSWMVIAAVSWGEFQYPQLTSPRDSHGVPFHGFSSSYFGTLSLAGCCRCCTLVARGLVRESRGDWGKPESPKLANSPPPALLMLLCFAASGKAVLCAAVVGGVPGCFARPLFFGRGAGWHKLRRPGEQDTWPKFTLIQGNGRTISCIHLLS